MKCEIPAANVKSKKIFTFFFFVCFPAFDWRIIRIFLTALAKAINTLAKIGEELHVEFIGEEVTACASYLGLVGWFLSLIDWWIDLSAMKSVNQINQSNTEVYFFVSLYSLTLICDILSLFVVEAPRGESVQVGIRILHISAGFFHGFQERVRGQKQTIGSSRSP